MQIDTIKYIVNFIDNHPALAIVSAWLVYRIGVWNERSNVIKALEVELLFHRNWINRPYPSAEPNPESLVYKLATTAIDNAIERGAGLFLNNQLVGSLVGYRQAINNFNQIADAVQSLKINIDSANLAVIPDFLTQRKKELVTKLHTEGIGDLNKPAAYSKFELLKEEIQKEKDSKVLPIIWFISNINFFHLKHFILKYF